MTQTDDPPEPIEAPASSERATTSPSDAAHNRHRSATEIADQYADIADSLHRWSWADRLLTGRYRQRAFGDAHGRVLDVACGTGTNFPHLPGSVELVGIDISQEMLDNARKELTRLSLDGFLNQMDAQALDFPDDSFDTVISALSTCTFPNPVEALQEMSRVCRPDGRILLLEHGRSDIRLISRFLAWRADAHYRKKGCQWNQEPLEIVQDAGLPILESQSAFLGMLTRIEATSIGNS